MPPSFETRALRAPQDEDGEENKTGGSCDPPVCFFVVSQA
jgi:hypothetical protein